MINRTYLQIPGPINVAERILTQTALPMINHRGEAFMSLVAECRKGMRKALLTENEIVFFPSSGSGALESAVVNFFQPGDTVIGSSNGVFSERVCKIAESYGLTVIRTETEWGKGTTPADLEQACSGIDKNTVKAVYLTHNETTTGVEADIRTLSAWIHDNLPEALVIVDAVSSLGCSELRTDEWKLDVVVSASQKGLMLPPGMGIVALSGRAIERTGQATLPRWYWDYQKCLTMIADNQMPYTPPTALFQGLAESLRIMEEKGLEAIWARHETIALAVREAVRAMGLTLYTEDEFMSRTVTAIRLPDGVGFAPFAKAMLDTSAWYWAADGIS